MDVWKEMYLSLMRDTERTIRTLADIKTIYQKESLEDLENSLPGCAEISKIYFATMQFLSIYLISAQQKCENIYITYGESPEDAEET